MSLTTMPNDILNKILRYSTEKIEDKIEKIDNLTSLNKVYEILRKKEELMFKKMNNEINKNCIYNLVFMNYKKELKKGVYLVNYMSIFSSFPTIHVARVEADNDNERIFGKYKIIESSQPVWMRRLVEYELVYERSEVNWNDEAHQFVGIKEPWLLYGYNHSHFDGYIRNDYQKHILYDQNLVDLANCYSIAIFVRSTKKYIVVKLPINSLEDCIYREHNTVKLSKRLVYKLLSQNIPLVRPTEIY
jgi:hypothetical protein